ncbi:hypothetical protein ABVK25_005729 [Lepraria finkii]|uniref:Rhodopsin domain-containing protein n=1 Tax=Lepraria finkii TaxID=1340010 RepID=A0ABR4B7R3_9LECA
MAASTQGASNGTQQAQGRLLPDNAITKEQGDVLIGVTCMLLTLCLAAVGGRLLARRMVKASLEADDYLAVGALVILVALAIEQFLIATSSGLGTVLAPGKLELASQITYILLITTARASILMLYRRIFSLGTKWFRVGWSFNVALVLGYCIMLLISFFLQCGRAPISSLWRSPTLCDSSVVGASIMGFLNAFIDTSILVLPIFMVRSLQMSYERKWAVCGIFALGLIGVFTSIARAISTLSNGRGTTFIIWGTAESAVALICACLPSLRQVFTRCYANVFSSNRKKGAPTEITFPTIIISPSCREVSRIDSRDEDKMPISKESHLVFLRDNESQ